MHVLVVIIMREKRNFEWLVNKRSLSERVEIISLYGRERGRLKEDVAMIRESLRR